MRRYRCVDAQKAAGFSVVAACQAAGVTRSAYYAWTTSTHRAADRHRKARLVSETRRIHARSHGTYGARRVHAELRRRGWAVNHKRVERLMRAHGIVGYRPADASTGTGHRVGDLCDHLAGDAQRHRPGFSRPRQQPGPAAS